MGFVEWVQRRLLANGFQPGTIDGDWGRKTIAALKLFQLSVGLKQTGATDEATVAALRNTPSKSKPVAAPKQDLYGMYPWMQIAHNKKGLHEQRDNAELRKFLKSDGHTLGDPAVYPWCGDFVETCIAIALPSEPLPTNPYLARNWMKFGKAVQPAFGAVLVFWRGSKTGTNGHVGFYAGEDETHYFVLGGNQSNSISMARVEKGRLLGARAPLTFPVELTHKVQMKPDGTPVTTNEA